MSGSQLSKREVSLLRQEIDRMSDGRRPTWKHVEALAESVTGRRFSRQSLSRKRTIEAAYSRRVEAYRRRRDTGRKEPEGVEDEVRRLLRLKDERIRELETIVAESDRRMNAIVANLHLRGVDVRSLPASLPEVRRS